MKTRALSILVALAITVSRGGGAGFTEPPITFYGTVTDNYDGYSLLTTTGQLAWTIQPTSGPSFVINTALNALPGGYSYRLQIPVEKVPTGFTLSVASVAATTASANYTRSSVTLDGVALTLVAPAGPTFAFAENQRGKMERVDLAFSTAFQDSDGDGLPDWWETLYGLNPFDPKDGSGDADGDGTSNRDEYLAGTNPLDPNDHLRITRVLKSGGLDITWTSVPGRKYRVDSATTLSGTFNAVSGVITAGPGEMTKSFTHPTGDVRRFYRVVVVP